MKDDNPFDKTMKINRQSISPITHDTLIEVTDTLDFCWAAARAVFEEAATPEHALKICEMVLAESTARNQEMTRQLNQLGVE